MPGSTLGGVFRTAIAAALLVLLLPAVMVANASSWAIRTVLDDQAFSVAVGRAMDTPTLRAVIADRVADEVTAYLGANPAAFHILASEILHIDGPATRDEVRAALRTAAAAALDDPAVRQARDEAVADLHAFLVGAATRQDGPIRVQGDELILDTRQFIERLAAAVDPRLTPQLVQLPESDRILILAKADAISTVRDTFSWLEVVQFLIPIVAIIAALAILGLAHRRVRALGLIGIAVTLAGAVTLVAAWVGGESVGGASSDSTVRAVTTEVYQAFLVLLIWQTVLVMLAGIVIALIAWLVVRRRRTTRSPSMSGVSAVVS
jgi:hypothetical protein